MEPDENDAVAVIEVDVAGETDDTPTVDTGDTTVIVETPVDDSAPAIDPFTERFVKLESRVDALESASFSKPDYQDVRDIAENAANDALETALDVDAEIVTATDEAIVETVADAEIDDIDNDGEDELIVDEIAPVSAKVHPLFRSLADWRNR